MNTQHEYIVVAQLKDTRTPKEFRIFATDRDEAVSFIKRLTRNTFKRLVSARCLKKATPCD
jgi:hypothetical protein